MYERLKDNGYPRQHRFVGAKQSSQDWTKADLVGL
jgi:hypothetical protein